MDTSKNYFQVFTKPILFIGILLFVGGAFTYTRMQTNLFPEVMFPRITIIADAGQLPIDRMMITVTKPLESAVKRVQGVTVVKSSTNRGVCTIDIFFEWGLDTYAKKIQIEEKEVTVAPDNIVISEINYPPEKPPGKIVGEGADAVPELIRLLREEAKVIS